MPMIITDRNWRDDLNPLHLMRPRVLPVGSIPGTVPYSDTLLPLIPEVEWPERIAEMTAKKLWPQDIYDAVNPRHKYQNGTPLCWIYSGAQAAEMTMAVQGRPYVELAPESNGAAGWRNVGYYPEKAMAWWAKNGLATREYVPDHVLNTSRFKEGWKDDAAKCKVLEGIDCGYGQRELNWQRACTMLFNGKLVPWVGLNWWEHAVSYGKLVVQKGEVCPYTRNTHARNADRILTGRYKYPDSLIAIRELTFRGAA